MKKVNKILLCMSAVVALGACNKKGPSQVLKDTKEEQLHFEEEYISGKFNYAEGGKFAISMISNIGTICGGVAFDSPTAVVSGIFGLLGSLNDNLNGGGPSIANVMSKLAEMDGKLDEINAKLDKNYSQLATEEIRTQAAVDQVLLEEQEAAISAFNTNYVEKITDYQRNFSDYLEQSYKSFVNKDEEVKVYVTKENKEWHLVPLADQGKVQAEVINIEIKDFTKSKSFLNQHYNTVSEGFIDSFLEDIEANLEAVALPANMEKKTLRDFAQANIVENFTKDYYVANHDKALEARNLAINFAKQINGKASKSILDRYVNRMKYMFNFAGEMKPFVIGSLANIAHTLDVNTTLAAQACLFAETSQDELRNEFVAARENIKDYAEAMNKFADNYSFLTNTNLTGGFYRAQYDVGYKNKGNHPTFHADFTLEKVNDDARNRFTKDDVTKHAWVNEIDHLKIATRYNLMRQNGITKAPNYIAYLVEGKVLPKEALNAYNDLINRKWISDDANRVFTGLTTRGMNGSDKFGLTCVEAGNPDGDYYKVGNRYTYKQGHDGDSWSGTVAETTYIDGTTGQIMTNKTVCAYATYAESHWYWSDDEYWAFKDNPVGNYFFALEHVAQ